MPTCLHPVRRKLGALTLAVVCVFMVGWTRSCGSWDYFEVIRDRQDFLLSSAAQQLEFRTSGCHCGLTEDCVVWESHSLDGYLALKQSDADQFEALLRSEQRINKLLESSDQFTPSELAAIKTEGKNLRKKMKATRVYALPYWSVVIPLTLLSAWLLLSKPRAKMSVKGTQI